MLIDEPVTIFGLVGRSLLLECVFLGRILKAGIGKHRCIIAFMRTNYFEKLRCEGSMIGDCFVENSRKVVCFYTHA